MMAILRVGTPSRLTTSEAMEHVRASWRQVRPLEDWTADTCTSRRTLGFEVTAAAYGGSWRALRALAAALRRGGRGAAGHRVLDVGAGPGALTAVLVDLVGAVRVAAIDPSQSFVAALHERLPGWMPGRGALRPAVGGRVVRCRAGPLVVHFMRDPVAGLREMGRVTRPGGTVSACVWDHATGGGPLSLFWDAVHELDPLAGGERGLAGAREGHLAELFTEAGLTDVSSGVLSVDVDFTGVDDWWEPFTYGVGPAGAYVADSTTSGGCLQGGVRSSASRGRVLLEGLRLGCDRPRGLTRPARRRAASDGSVRRPGDATGTTTFPIFWPLPAYRCASTISSSG